MCTLRPTRTLSRIRQRVDKRKTLLAVALISIIAVIVGVLAYIYFTGKEIAGTVTETSPQSGTVSEETPVPDEGRSVPRSPAGDCFFVDQSACSKAFVPVRKGETMPAGGLGFFLSAGELDVIAPADGYVAMYFKGKNRTDPRVVMTDDADWTIDRLAKGAVDSGHTFYLYAPNWKDVIQGKVKKGERIGTAILGDEIYSGVMEQKMNFGISISKSWTDRLENISKDPIAHITYLVGQMNNRMQ